MVVLHSLDAKAAAGVTRYSRELAAALRAIGEPVRELRIRPLEVAVGRRRVGGFLTMRLQSAVRPWRKHGLLHSTYHYAAHPRCDVATVHDVFPESRSEELGFGAVEVAAMRRTTERLLRRGVRLVAVSQATRAAFLDLYPGHDDQVVVAPPGISARFAPPQRPRPHPAFRAGRFNVLCVADLNPRKRLDWLLQAALDVDDPRLHVVHAGPDTVRRPPWALQRQREEPLAAALGDRLTRLGRLDDAGLLAAYQSADLLVLPTLDEGFGFPPVEALSCGTPVAVPDLPVLRETLGAVERAAGSGGGHGTGAQARPKAPAGLPSVQWFRGPDGLSALVRAAMGAELPPVPSAAERQARHAAVQQEHGWPRAAHRLTDVYEGVLAST